jgi:hypothetical protein
VIRESAVNEYQRMETFVQQSGLDVLTSSLNKEKKAILWGPETA